MLLAAASVMCLFLFSCGQDNTVEAFAKAVDKTSYREAKVTTETVSILGTLKGEYSISIADDGSATVGFSYETWYKVDEGSASDVKKTVSGTVVRDKNGSYSGDTESLNFDVTQNSSLSLDLLAIPADKVAVSEDGATLEATVPSEDTEAVFGRAYGFSVTLKVIKTDGAISSVEMSYETEDVSCKILSVYT